VVFPANALVPSPAAATHSGPTSAGRGGLGPCVTPV